MSSCYFYQFYYNTNESLYDSLPQFLYMSSSNRIIQFLNWNRYLYYSNNIYFHY